MSDRDSGSGDTVAFVENIIDAIWLAPASFPHMITICLLAGLALSWLTSIPDILVGLSVFATYAVAHLFGAIYLSFDLFQVTADPMLSAIIYTTAGACIVGVPLLRFANGEGGFARAG